jgi:hypothetical protein
MQLDEESPTVKTPKKPVSPLGFLGLSLHLDRTAPEPPKSPAPVRLSRPQLHESMSTALMTDIR